MGLIMFAFFALLRSTSEDFKALGVACIAVCCFHMAFHTVWGDEFFLYSSHWHSYLVLFFCGLFVFNPEKNKLFNSVFSVFIILVAINNYDIINQLIQHLEHNKLA